MDTLNKSINEEIEIRVPCKAEYVHTVRRTVVDFAEVLNLPSSAVAELEIAASEAITNVIKHAYKDSATAPPVRVKCSRKKDGLTVEVIDKGSGFTVPQDSTVPSVDFDREGGYGIVLIRSLMDRVKYTSKPDAGTRIKMTKTTRKAITESMRVKRADHI